MGNVLAPVVISMVVVPLANLAAQAVIRAFRRPDTENPTISEIQVHHQAGEAQRQAEQAAREAQEHAEQIQRQADQDREEAQARQEEANQAAVRAVGEVEQMRARMEEAADAARRAQELAEEASRAAREEASRLAREAQEECQRSQKIQEGMERAMAAAIEEVERAQRAADEQRREADAAKALAEQATRVAAEETRKAIEAKEEAERRLREGIQPVVMPSSEELAAAKRRIEYREDCFHFAVTGISGSGKSSLVNSFRGLRSRDAGAAAVGVTETTLHLTRYSDIHPENPFVWYDIPGAGTLKCRDWQYFNDQGLYVFDCLIVLIDNRFTITDIAILVNARRFNIPTYIVRSKADQHIHNIIVEEGDDAEDIDIESRDKSYEAARSHFIEETRKSIRTNLEDANLPDQRVYIISSGAMLNIVLGKVPKKSIDEVDLVNDLLNQAYARRVTRSDEIVPTSADPRSK